MLLDLGREDGDALEDLITRGELVVRSLERRERASSVASRGFPVGHEEKIARALLVGETTGVSHAIERMVHRVVGSRGGAEVGERSKAARAIRDAVGRRRELAKGSGAISRLEEDPRVGRLPIAERRL